MGYLSWFGGFVTSKREALCAPGGSRPMTPAPCPVWTIGSWPEHEARVAVAGLRRVAIFGPCSANNHELSQLAQRGVSDAVLLAFAGSYTVVESIAECTTVFTDIGHAWPIYTVKTEWGTVWGSSALALAALVGAGTDLNWVASALLAPQAPELVAGRSAFTGITAVPPGSRLVMHPNVPPQVLGAWRPAPATAEVAE